MNLKKLHLYKFRCFEDLEIIFHDKVTVIIGENGVGKTTILEAAAIAIGTLLYSFKRVNNYSIKKTDAHNEYFNMGNDIDVQPQYPVEVFAEGCVAGQSIKWRRTLNSETGNTTIIEAKDMTQISEDYQKKMMRGDTTLVLPIIAYYGTGRLWDYHRKKKNDTFKTSNRANGYIDCLDGMANVKLMLNWFKKKAWKDRQSATPPLEFVAVREAMERCFSLITGLSDVKVQFNPDTTEIDLIYPSIEQEIVKIPLNQLSDGYKGTISLIADIAYRMAILNPGLLDRVLTETDGIVLIDEVDLHLHPAWQQRVIKDLRTIFPKVQFIVITHAPAVINSVQSDNIVMIKNLKLSSPNSQVYGKDVKSVLNEIMGVTERPPEVAELFNKFYEQLTEKKFNEADHTLKTIDELRDYHDSEVSGCRVKLKLERIRGGLT